MIQLATAHQGAEIALVALFLFSFFLTTRFICDFIILLHILSDPVLFLPEKNGCKETKS